MEGKEGEPEKEETEGTLGRAVADGTSEAWGRRRAECRRGQASA